MERDWFGGIDYVLCKNFNSHAHVERDQSVINPPTLETNFNSHAHVERDPKSKNPLLVTNISTHTLTWSVTTAIITTYILLQNFNSHAHVERDDFGHLNVVDYCDFNSHAHVERDVYNNHRTEI